MYTTATPTSCAAKPSKDFVAASALPLILAILSQGDSYGYAIGQRAHELSGGELEWADGMLYPILHRLEQRQLIEAYWGVADNGRKRKYYRLRPSGREELAVLRAHWQRVHHILHQLEEATDVRPGS